MTPGVTCQNGCDSLGRARLSWIIEAPQRCLHAPGQTDILPMCITDVCAR
jgi:hypothetical protein